jgi:DNA-binding response OmpR family regulator
MTAKKILIVEDDLELAHGLSIRLRANGYIICVAADVKSAVSTAQKEEPDIIILDIGLPDGDGFGVMEQLKSLTPPLKIPIVMITGRDPLKNEQRALDSGIKAFLQKPVANDVLLRTIREALRESGVPVLEKSGKQIVKEAAYKAEKKVLVVDDDLDLLRGLETRLKANGYTVFVAVDANSSVRLAQKAEPDVIILDIGLPGGDGFNVIELMKSLIPPLDIPVIILTGMDSMENRKRAVVSGVKAYLRKPVDNDALLKTLRAVLAGNGGQFTKAETRKTAKKILVVDDDLDLLRGLETRLKANDYAVFTAADAKSAVSAAQKEEPDIIILDIGLPDGDGFAVMRQLKSLTPPLKIPVIIITGRDPLETEQRALDSGVQAFLRKPVDNYVLLRMLSQILRESEERKQERNREQA